MAKRKRILICPLDWGLGHATRCIPLIRFLLDRPEQFEVLIAADGRPYDLLKKEFPIVEFIRLPGYNIQYSKKNSLSVKLFFSIPTILRGIKREHTLLAGIITEKNIDVVISDNRYGLWSKKIPCYFITHQLTIKVPRLLTILSLNSTEILLRKINYSFIRKYTQCWIPDAKETENLAGGLSHPFRLPSNAQYMGIMSRFEKINTTSTNFEYDLLVLLSGPEPQRTELENIILHQTKGIQLKTLIIRGIPENDERKKISETINIVSHIKATELEKIISSSRIILSRPGYSSIMDLTIKKKKAIFVPTPGQTEQEYLANYLFEKRIAYFMTQEKFDLQLALKETEKFNGFTKNYADVREWLQSPANPLLS